MELSLTFVRLTQVVLLVLFLSCSLSHEFFIRPIQFGQAVHHQSRSVLQSNISLPVSHKEDTPKRFAFPTLKEIRDFFVREPVFEANLDALSKEEISQFILLSQNISGSNDADPLVNSSSHQIDDYLSKAFSATIEVRRNFRTDLFKPSLRYNKLSPSLIINKIAHSDWPEASALNRDSPSLQSSQHNVTDKQRHPADLINLNLLLASLQLDEFHNESNMIAQARKYPSLFVHYEGYPKLYIPKRSNTSSDIRPRLSSFTRGYLIKPKKVHPSNVHSKWLLATSTAKLER